MVINAYAVLMINLVAIMTHLPPRPSSQATSGTIPSASDPTHPPLRHGSSAIMRLESLRKGSGINASLLQNMVASAHVSDWEIDPKRLTLCERPDGSVWELGRGAYSRVRSVC